MWLWRKWKLVALRESSPIISIEGRGWLEKCQRGLWREKRGSFRLTRNEKMWNVHSWGWENGNLSLTLRAAFLTEKPAREKIWRERERETPLLPAYLLSPFCLFLTWNILERLRAGKAFIICSSEENTQKLYRLLEIQLWEEGNEKWLI